jgi:hypothetical protein
MNRTYGKPDETVRQADANPATAVLRSMSLEEKLELLERLRRGPGDGEAGTPVYPVVLNL